MTIERLGLKAKSTTELAAASTVLSPRFYTTDYQALDRMDISPVREEWDRLLQEMRDDPNKAHFRRSEEWDKVSLDDLEPGLRKEFVDHLKTANKDNKAAGVLTSDRVHLNEAGNRFVADAMLKVLVK